MQLTINGLVAGPNGEMDWMIWNWDDELKKYVQEITEPVDCILLGRVLAQGFIPTWKSMDANPETANAFSRKMNDTLKIVFTKTLQQNEWDNTQLVNGQLEEEVTRIKEQPGKDMIEEVICFQPDTVWVDDEISSVH